MLEKTLQSISLPEFKNLAKSISDKPLSRIPANAIQQLDPSKLKTSNEVFIDVHAHSFTLSHVPGNFIKALNFLSREYKQKILNWLSKNIAQFIGQEKAISILEHLFKLYEKSFKNKGLSPKIFIVNLMMDMERGISGDPNKSYLDQLIELVEIRNKTSISSGINYGEQLLPFLAVDPHNPEIFAQFLTVFDEKQNHTNSKKLDNIAPFVGIKLYTPLGYLPSDPTLMEIFEICEKKNIPIMTHVGGYRTKTEFEKFQIGSRVYQDDGSFQDIYREVTIPDKEMIKSTLIQPFLWKTVLDQFPRLKVCFAHMGDKDEWTKYRNNPNDFTNHVWQSLELIKDPKYNTYADISYSFTVKRNVQLIKELMKDPVISKKLLFGSDFFLTEVEKRRTKESFDHLLSEFMQTPDEWKKLTYQNTCEYLFGT